MREFFSTEFLVALISCLPASVAFAILYKINPRHLLLGGVAGVITYFIYYTIEFFTGEVFLAALVSTMFTTLFSEIAARVRRAPNIVFLIPGVILTVPGSSLYKAMRYMLENDWARSFENLMTALLICLGIASGIVIVTAIYGSIKDRRRRGKRRADKPSNAGGGDAAEK